MPSRLRRLTDRLGALMPPEPQEFSDLAPRLLQRHVKAFAVFVVAFLVVSYLLMVNRYWHLAADSGVYLSVAQNLRAGNGYVHNGLPYGKYPGGWPYLLALSMRVSSEFLWLNLVQCATMLAALGVLYLALRQMADRATALLVLLLTGTLFWVHEYATSLMSEAPFFLFSNLALLLLLRLVRSREERPRALLLVGMCAAWALAFWCRVVACFWIGPFAAALFLGGRAHHRLRSRVLNASVASLVILLGLFIYFDWVAGKRVMRPPDVRTGYRVHGGSGAAVRRAARLPRWPLLMLCPPWDAAPKRLLPGPIASAGNWLATGVVLLGAWEALRRGQATAAASVLFFLPFALWGAGAKTTTGRYAMGVAPLLVLLFLLGLRSLATRVRRRLWPRLAPRLVVQAGVAFIFLPNLLLLAGDVAVQRSAEFYRLYRAGAYRGLLGMARWMADGEMQEVVACQDSASAAVVAALTNCRFAHFTRRFRLSRPGAEAWLMDFARQHGARYVITRNFDEPWPAWHVDPRRLGEAGSSRPYFQLWEVDADEGVLRPLEVPPASRWPTRLPGKPPLR